MSAAIQGDDNGLARHNVERVHCGVDWITATMKPDCNALQQFIYEMNTCLLDIKEDGNVVKRSGLQGYRGLGVDHNFVGHSDQGTLVQFTGRFADVVWPHLIGYPLHIARVDLASTVTYRVMPEGVEEVFYDSSVVAAGSLPPTRRRQVSRFSNNTGGTTVYIGSPSSEQRGRVYNKERQSKDPVYLNSWRYEVVFRNEPATRWFSILSASGPMYRPLVASIVADWFTRRGVDCTHWNDVNLEVRPPPVTRLSDVESKLLWLEKQVRPAVQWLISNGHQEHIAAALGLPGCRREPDISEEP